MNEQFSAFLDEEATRDEADSVVNALLRDPELRESWSRQHWLRTTLRAHSGEIAVALDTSFSDRVMRAIAAEDRDAIGTPAPVAALRQARAPRRRRWRNMAGLAAAASAAGFVLLVSNPLQRDGRTEQVISPASTSVASTDASVSGATLASNAGAQQIVASNDISGDMLSQASAQQAAVREGPADHWSVSDPALEDELNSYLVEHNGLARGYGLSGTTPAFVRVATYGQEPTQ